MADWVVDQVIGRVHCVAVELNRPDLSSSVDLWVGEHLI